MKWVIEDGMAFPACRKCGNYPMSYVGKDEYGFYLMRCPYCGKVEVLKTNPTKLVYKALDRRWRR